MLFYEFFFFKCCVKYRILSKKKNYKRKGVIRLRANRAFHIVFQQFFDPQKACGYSGHFGPTKT